MSHLFFRRSLGLGLSMSLALTSFSSVHALEPNPILVETQVLSENTTSTSPVTSLTQGKESYSVKVTTKTATLFETSEGYCRVESLEEEDVVRYEYYDQNFYLLSSGTVPVELNKYSAFYEGDDYFFLLFAGSNPNEDDSAEVLRLVKYDKNWNRLSSAVISDVYAVSAGSHATMVEWNGNILIHCSRTMYKAADGLNHQSNLHVSVDIASMRENSDDYLRSTGYYSHSFNELFDVAEDGTYAYANHGDAYPRALGMSVWSQSMPSQVLGGSSQVLQIAGNIGNNTTKARLGSLQIGSSQVLLAGSSVTQNDNFAQNTDYNVFVANMDRDSSGALDSTLTWYTNYDGSTWASNPYLVECSEDKFILMWNEFPYENNTPPLYWTVLDGSGKQITDISSGVAPLSLVEPFMNQNGDIVWYSSLYSTPTFYTLNLNTGEVSESNHYPSFGKTEFGENSVSKTVCSTDGTAHTLVTTTLTLDGTSATKTVNTLKDFGNSSSNSGTIATTGGDYLQNTSQWAWFDVFDAVDQSFLAAAGNIFENMTGPITREQFCVILMNVYTRIQGTNYTIESVFQDIDRQQINLAYHLGIVSGKTATHFEPNAPIQRQELAIMIKNMASLFVNTEVTSIESRFLDQDDISDWAREAVAYAEQQGFLSGSNGLILPQDDLTCEQAITVIMRLYESLT